LVKPKHVGAFIENLHVNFNILNQFHFALVGKIKDLIIVRNIQIPLISVSSFTTTSSGEESLIIINNHEFL
jgi:hypothetical protein